MVVIPTISKDRNFNLNTLLLTQELVKKGLLVVATFYEKSLFLYLF